MKFKKIFNFVNKFLSLALMLVSVFATVFAPQSASARVFNFKDEAPAAFFSASGGLTKLGDTAFANSSGGATQFTDAPMYNYSGELGFAYTMSPILTVRASLQIVQAQTVTNIEGKNAGGIDLLSLTSKISAVNPNVTIEYDIMRGSESRLYAFAGVGSTTVSMDNTIDFDAANSPYGLSDFIEKSSQVLLTGHGGAGYETLFADNVTFFSELGYRQMAANKMTYSNDYATTGGAKTGGSQITNDDGTKRIIDLGGFYVGIGFKFYITVL